MVKYKIVIEGETAMPMSDEVARQVINSRLEPGFAVTSVECVGGKCHYPSCGKPLDSTEYNTCESCADDHGP